MTDEETRTPQEQAKFDERYSKELSVSTYFLKQIRDIVVIFGSVAVGIIGGNMIGTKLGLTKDTYSVNANKHRDDIADLFGTSGERIVPKTISAPSMFIGAFVGSLLAGITLGYSRWRKHESERLAVDEMNEDISNIRIKTQTDPELVAENTLLRDTLYELTHEKKTTGTERDDTSTQPNNPHLERGPRSHHDYATEQSANRLQAP